MEKQEMNIMELPAIVIDELIPFPNSEVRLDLSSKRATEGLKLAEQYQNTVVGSPL